MLENIDQVCRTCLKEDVNMKPLFDNGDEIPMMIKLCSITEISKCDGLPNQVCIQCLQDLKTSYTFKLKCEKSYQTLREIILNQNNTENLEKTENHQKNNSRQNEIMNINTETQRIKLDPDFSNIIENDLNTKCTQTEEVAFHQCERCDLKFINEESLRNHRVVHKGTQNSCRICSKTYSRLNHLRRHMAATHPEDFRNKSRASECNICKKLFTRTEHLRRHMLLHSADNELGDANKKVKSPNLELLKEEMYQDDNTNNFSNLNQENESEEIEKRGEFCTESNPSIDEKFNIKMELGEGKILNDFSDDHENIKDDSYEYIEDGEDSADEELLRNEDVKFFSIEKRKRGRPRKSELCNSKSIEIYEEKYKCKVCKNSFHTKADCDSHTENCKTASQTHECKICNKIFSRATHLKRHEITHSEVKPHQCQICEKRFTRLDHLNIHMHHHAEKKPFECKECHKGFTRAEHLKKHKEARHSGQKPPTQKTEFCQICNKGFTTAKYLQIHMRMHSERVFSCKMCPNTFQTKSELAEHSKTHVNERPFLCSECGLRFVRNDYLVIHMRRHKGEKPYKCKFCGKGFPRATDLTVHERYHTGEKTHLCTICGKGFQRAYNLLVHTRVHTGERPYQCPHCVKSFAQGNDLKAHVRRHTGERYKCEICGDGFIQGYHLTQHKRTVHGINMTSHIRRVEKFISPPTQEQQMQSTILQIHQHQHHQQHQTETATTIIPLPLDIKIETGDSMPIPSESDVILGNTQTQTISLIHQQNQMEVDSTQMSILQNSHEVESGLPDMPVTLFSTIHQKIKLPPSFQ